ncbi:MULTISPECIES: ABC transporter substrate-binding protein [Rhizobium]|uniref:Extracellular solute-binding protein n=1 Tax=Rhizobium rhododendri TaxID=2506430 RepID=A0ABY8IQA2_9HYPH|nr:MULTISPECIES: extracellular solute-binding protein [Rhizobium]MBZ5762495.1 extracellular solute-binding protein [Rhizobium sp. VS19-DR96]MBZ5768490.1 extracellular solute-binding protein [Rhizobium sp. VS19-DR129.2]MBZ5776008.1 extracellular solute-binding protein [Rhizobium sp. VS19-DRK62.2]MBZ5787220.1 extracellular solute-binding protein [Rhizobium sp. VS19-DR121]MBZ5804573.1 extracellular solute-binding protein [Rhizobium sp. VS19-DR181]
MLTSLHSSYFMTHRNRKLTARILSVTLSLSAIALPISAEAAGVTLKVFGGSSLDVLAPREKPEVQTKIRDEIISGFLKAHPEVASIEWDAQGPQAGSLQRMMTAKLSGQEMDLVACSAFWVNGAYVRRGLLKPITDDVKPFAANVDATSFGAFTVNGKIYGVPISSLSTSTIFYNVGLFKKLGIPTPPTYEDLKAAVPKLKAAGVIPLLHQGANSVMWPMWYFETLSQSSGDAVSLTQQQLEGNEPFDDAKSIEAFQLIKQWTDDGILSKDSLSVDMEGMRAAFASGKSAMYYGGTWEVPSLKDSVKNFTWGVFPFPKMPGTPGAPKHGGGADNGMCLSASIPDEKVKPALDFIAYLTKPDIAKIYLDADQPIATSIKGVDGVDEPYAKELRANTFPDTVKFLDWVWPSEVTSAVASGIAGVVGGTTTPQDAAKSVEAAFKQLVDDGNWPPKD